MILTDAQASALREALDTQMGLDDELLKRCGPFLHSGAFDDAARHAFLLLEERLRVIADSDDEKLTGAQLVHNIMGPNGWLGKQLGGQREDFFNLFISAFKLFRNTTAHRVANYDQSKGRAVIGLVNLLLILLKEIQPPIVLPDNVENLLTEFNRDKAYGADIANKLRAFAIKCVQMGMVPQKVATQWIPFRRRVRVKYPHWTSAKVTYFPVFYIYVAPNEKGLRFSLNQYYAHVAGFDVESFRKALAGLGAQASGKNDDYIIDLRVPKSHDFFKKLIEQISRTNDDLAATTT